MKDGEIKQGYWYTTPELWAKLQPLARQMRHDPTPAENLLWTRLRNRRVRGVKFRRQYPIERFIVDFYSHHPRMAIEVDGPIHDYTPDEDAIRQAFIESLNIRVFRFKNAEVLGNIGQVLAEIEAELAPEWEA